MGLSGLEPLTSAFQCDRGQLGPALASYKVPLDKGFCFNVAIYRPFGGVSNLVSPARPRKACVQDQVQRRRQHQPG
jgi:hypothetical protein